MFSIEWMQSVGGVNGRTGVVYRNDPFGSKTRVCNVTTWGLGSCAVATLQSWGQWCRVDSNKVDQFYTWLCENVDNDWNPNEFYFLFSSTQKRGEFKRFIKHPNVKLRDKFENKSHGPNTVYLYRYSKAEDFKRIVNRKAKV